MAFIRESARPNGTAFHGRGFFRQVKIDPELGVVSWPNGYDICSDVLRYYCELGRVASKDEMEAHFAPKSAPNTGAMVMNDKPNG